MGGSQRLARLSRGFVLAVCFSTVVYGLPIGPIDFAHAADNYSTVILQDAPTAYWRLGEAAGATTAADASGHSLTLTYAASVVLGASGAIVGDANTAALFNGTSAYASRSTAPLSATSNWSLEAWLYPTALPQLGTVIYNGIDDSTHGGYGFEIASSTGGSGSNIVGVLGSAGIADSGYTLPAANRWYHVVMTRDSSTIRFYVNGQQTPTTSTKAPATPGADASLGGGLTATGSLTAPFAGIIDEAAMYGSAISQGRIVAHYQEGANVQTAFGKWVQQSPATVPAARSDASVTYDGAHNQVLMFGGKNSSGTALAETWTYNGTNWTKLSPATSPSARSGGALAYDAATSTTVLFGGYTGSKFLNDTWSWNGTTWSQLSPGTSPTIRAFASAAYRAADSTIVLFGGQGGKSTFLSDTWTWTGTTWSKKSPTTSPTVRYLAPAAYDSATSNVVLFGGNSGSASLGDTWSWNGTTWTQSTGSPAPSIRQAAALAFDAATNSLTLFGGYNGTSYLSDTWAWDGTTWSAQLPATSAPARADGATAFQTATGSILLYGGTNGAAQSDTWAWTTPPSAPLNVQATRGNAQASVTWNAPSSNGGTAISSYTVTPYSGTTAGSATSVTGTTATISGLTNGTTYTFQVIAVNSIGNGPGANSNSVTPATTPGAPTGVTATAGNTQATVNWTAPSSNGGSAITGYTVTSSPGSFTATTTGATTATVTGLTNGTAYTFTVTATNSVGTGPASSASNSVTPATVPGAPTSVNATAGNAQATITWTAPSSNGGSAITSYTVTPYIGSTAQTSTTVTGSPPPTTATINGLTNGTSYTFQVTATNSVGTSTAGTSNPVTPLGPPGAPTNVTATAGNAQTTVTWLAPSANGGSAITNYTVTPYIGSTAQTASTVTGSPPATTITITGLTNGTTYTFQVTATNSVGTGAAGISNAATPATVPGPPGSVTATGGNTQATVTWTAPASNGGSAITGYTVTPYIGTTAQTPTTVGASVLTTTITGLTNGTTYTFQVTASNSLGTSTATTSNAVTPATVPGAPTNVTATAGNASASVSWTAPASNGGSAITSYTVTPYIGTTAQTPVTVTAPATSTTVTGLSNGTAYTFQVTATNSAGTGPAGATSTSVTPMTVPDAPTGVTATAGNAQATVSWTAPANNGGSAITGYTVTPYIGTTAQAPTTVGSAVTSTTITGLSNGTTYTFQVAASNTVGTGAAATSNAVTPAAPPSAPQNVTATAGNTQATVNWQAPASNGGAAITSYTVTPYIGTTAQPGWTVSGTTTSFTATGLTNGTTYTFQVAAINSAGTSPVGTSNAVTPATTPTAPQNVTAVTGNQQATVSWNPPATNGGSAVTSYTITPYVGTTAGVPVTTSGPTTSQVVTGLTNGTSYTFQVYASNSVGPGPVATSNSVVVGLPAAPTGVTATAGANQATVTWTASVTNGASIYSYFVQSFVGSQRVNATAAAGSATSVTMSGLRSGVAYTFQITAKSNDGDSPPSAMSAAATPSGTATTYASTVLADNPMLYYRLDDGSSIAADSSGNNGQATYQSYPYSQGAGGALVNDPDGAVAFGLACCWSGGYVLAASNSGPSGASPRSIEAWFNTSGTGTVLGYGGGVTHGVFQLNVSGSTSLTLVTWGDDKTFTTPYVITNSNWHHVIVTYDGATTLTAFLDGQLLGTASVSAALNTWVSGVVIGHNFDQNGGLLTGSIDEVALYPSALTAAQVAAHFNASGNTRPSIPGAVTATAGTNQATVTWTASTSSAGAPVTGYVVTAMVGAQAENAVGVGGTVTTATLSGLTGGLSYTFQVLPINNFGNGPVATSNAVTPSGTSTTYFSTILGNVPAVYYRLGDPSGTVAADSSGNGRHASYQASPYTLGSAGALIGDADGGVAVANSCCSWGQPTPGSYVQYRTGSGLPMGSSARSYEAWIKTSSVGGVIMAYGSQATHQAFQLDMQANNSIRLVTWGDDKTFVAPYVIANGNWHNVVVTYDGTTTLTAYIDGQSMGTATLSGALSTVNNGNGLIMGQNFWLDGNGQFNGTLDEVAVYPIALSASQVLTDFNASGNMRPTAPGNVTATAATNQATVSWSASSTSAGSPVTAYVVTAFNGGRAQNAIGVSGTTTSATLSGLAQGVTYTFQVAGSNNFGTGAAGSSGPLGITAGSATTYASTVLAANPALYYRLSDPSGPVAADSSGNGRNGAYLNSPYTPGVSGAIVNDSDPAVTFTQQCCQIGGFPYAGGYIQYRSGAGLPVGSTARTLEAWINTTTVGRVVFSYGSQNTHQAFQLDLPADNQVRLVTWNDDKVFNAPYSITNGKWHHIAVTYDGVTTLTAYVDGQSIGTATVSSALNTAMNGNGLLVALNAWGDGGGFWNGSLDELAIYPSALTAAQILGNFNASGNTRPTAPGNVTPTAGANQASVIWSASTASSGAPVTGYLVTAYNGTQAQNAMGLGASATSATFTGLPANVAYTFQVVATNNFGTGAAGVSSAVTTSGSPATYASTVQGDGPTFYYRLGDPSGSVAADSSGNNHHGAYLGSPYSLGAAGALTNDGDSGVTFTQNCCLIGGFPYIGGYVQYRSGAGLPLGGSARSLEAWFKTTSVGGVIAGWGVNNTHQIFQLQVPSNNKIQLVSGSDDHTFVTPYLVTNGNWHHVVATYDGATTVTLYLDGQSLGTQTLTGALNTALSSNDGPGLLVGNDYAGAGNQWWNGSLDEVAIYPAALSATQVSNHFNASGNMRPTAPTITSVTAGPNSATINWTASSTSSGAPVNAYLITAYKGSQPQNAQAVSGTTTSTTMSGLQGGVAYSFQIVATNNFGNSAPSTAVGTTPSGGGSTYASTIIASGPVVYYRLGDPSGSVAADSSGNGRNGTYINSPLTLGSPGAVVGDSDTSVGFAGNCCLIGGFPYGGGYMQTRPIAGVPLGNAARSVEAWVKTTANGTQSVLGYGLSGSTRQAFQVRIVGTNQIQVVTGNDDHSITTPAGVVLNDGTWHQVVVTYDGTTLTAFVDGQSIGTAVFSGALNTALDDSGLVIANDFWQPGSADQFIGSIDEPAVYAGVLTLAQIQGHYQAAGYSFGIPGAPTGATATAGTNQATVSWTAPASTGTSAINTYTITPHVGSTVRTPTQVSGTQTSATIANLNGGTSYTFTVVAANNSGSGPSSAPSNAVTVTGTTYPYSTTILGDTPAAYWRLGDSPGVPATDATGNGNNGTYSGAFTQGQAGPIVGDPNTAVLFDGTSGHLSVPSSATLDMINGLTIETWAKFSSAGTTQLLVNKGDGANASASAYELGFVPGTGFVFDTFSGGTMTRAASSTSVTPGQWYHLVGTRTVNGTLLLYVNGLLVGAANDGGGLLNNVNAPVGLAGSGLGTGANLFPFAGTLCEVAIYPSALSSTQVANHWQLGGYRATAPTAVSATAGANQATVTWTAPSGGPAVTGYLVTPKVGTTLRTPTSVGAGSTSATVSNLSAASYSFTVTAINAYGVGAASSASTAVSVTGTTYPYAGTVLGNGPAGYWRMGEGSGTMAVDASGNGNAGTFVGGITPGQSGAIQGDPDQGIRLDGSTGRVLVPSSPSLAITGSLTLEAWVKFTSVATTQVLINKGDGATAQQSAYQLAYVTGQGFAFSTFIANTTNTAGQSNKPASAGTWYHVVGTRTTTGTLTLYVNGSSAATSTDGGAAVNTVDSPVGIGAAGSGFGSRLSPLAGSIDEVAIYPIALTMPQVAANWDNGGFVPGPPTNVTARLDANNQATVSWLPPSYSGTSPITSYSIIANLGSNSYSPIVVDGASFSANVPNLEGGLTYTFSVAAVNASGTGPAANTGPVVPTAPPNPNLGEHFEILAQNTSLPFGFFSVNGPIITTASQWTIEGWMWGFGSNADTGGNSAWGLLAEAHCQVDTGATPTCPSAGPPVAGIEMRTGSSPLGSSFVWPGGSYPIPSGGFGYPDAPTPTHYALDYDGTTVRGFINGNLLFSSAASGLGGLEGYPGIADSQNMKTGNFDEFRISTVARYTTSFTPQTTNFLDHDGLSQVLYHFDGSGARQLFYMKIYTYTNLSTSLQVPQSLGGPVAFADTSGNNNHGIFEWAGSPQITGGFPMAYAVFSLPQGQSVTAADIRSPSESNFTCNWGPFPVNCSSGEFYHTFTDLVVPGRGVPLSFQRTYSSLHASASGSLGYGWTDSYNMSLSIAPVTGNATVNEESWSGVTFTPDQSNTFQAPPRVFATLVKNGDGTYTFTRKNQIHFVFDSTGRLIREVDRNGYATVLSYNGAGQLATVTDPAGRALVLGYTGGMLTSIADDSGRTASFQYDANGNLTQATDVAGGVSKFTYDGSHLLLTMKDAKCVADSTCNGVVNTFDAGGRVLTQTDPMNRKTTFNYQGSTTAVTDPNGNETDETYMYGMLMLRTVGANTSQPGTWRYTYDPNSLTVQSISDPAGNVTSISYDAMGNPLNAVDPLGRTRHVTYDSLNDPLTVTDPLGVQTTYTYDANGNVTSISTPLSGTGQQGRIAFSYDPARPGDVLTMTDENSKNWTYSYDQYGDRLSSADPLGDTATFQYDTIGRLNSSVSPKGNVTGGNPAGFTSSYTHDAFGALTQAADPLMHTIQYRYDGNGNLARLTDANNNVTNYAYDFDNELTTATRADNTQLQYSYDGNGNLTLEKNGLNRPVVTYAYDTLNRVKSSTDNLQRTTTYGYDSVGNRTTVSDPQGRTATYNYNLDHELTGAIFSDGLTPSVAITYDVDGQRLTMADGTGTAHYSYDSLHRLTQSINGAGAAVGYGYDLAGHLTSITYPGGSHVVNRGYDDAGRLTSVTDWLGRGGTSIVYDANSNPITQTYPNGVVETSTYDYADRLVSIADTVGSNTILNLSYSRDNANQLTAENSTSYGYNSLRQLTTAGSGSYSYDAADRLTQHAVTGGTTTNLVYDVADQLQSLTVLNGSTQQQQYTYTYDPQGNRVSKTDQSNVATTYSYDQVDRLMSIGSANLYVYDGAGLRMSKTVGGVSEAFVWDQADGLPLLLQDGSTSYLTGLGGVPLEQISSAGTPLYYHHDQLGSTRAITDGSANVVATYSYDAYGNINTSTGSVANPFQFAGAYIDSESGLLYLRARYYDPTTGSFLTRDAISAMQPYSYAADTPLDMVDPSGLAPSFVRGFEDFIQGAPQRGMGLFNNVFFGPEQALSNGDCLGFLVGLASFVAPEFRAGAAVGIVERESALAAASRASFKAADNVGAFTVPLKHTFGSGGRWAKFAKGVDAKAAIAEALRSKNAVFSPNNVEGSFRVTTDLGRPIGSKGQTAVRVIVGDDGKIWTAFPVNP